MKKLVLIAPVRQTIWQWPAVINLICGGMASGYYLVNLLAASGAEAAAGPARFQVAQLTPALIVLIGFAAVGIEAARPMAAKYLLHHLHTSWMSREVLAGSGFILFSVLDMLFPQFPFIIPAALCAFGLLLSQAMMVYRCRAVASWNQGIIPLHFLASGIYLGFGLLLILDASKAIAPGSLAIVIGLLTSIASLVAWYRYAFSTRSGSLNQSQEPLLQTIPMTLTIGLGHLIPIVMLLLLLLLAALGFNYKTLKEAYALAGIAILLGASTQKYYIILRANILRELISESCKKYPAP